MLLEQLLRIPIFKHAEVLAGQHGLRRNAGSVNIMDAPDIINYLKKDELLLTNGYFVKDRPDALITLMTDMHAMGCTGLAIKTKRFSLDIPRHVLDEADRLQFPIIELSAVTHSLGEIFQQSTSTILENKSHELHYALTIHKQFSAMIMHGKGISEIIDMLTQLVSVPVLLVNSKLQVTGRSQHFHHPDMQALIAATLSTLPTLFSEPAAPLSLCLLQEGVGNNRHVELFPIHTYRHEGYIIAYHTEQNDSKLSLLAMEQAANVIGLELTKRQAVKERSRRYKNEFFLDLVEGYITSEQEALHRGKKYGLNNQDTSIILVCKQDEYAEPDASGMRHRLGASLAEDRLYSERDAHYEMIKRAFSALGLPFVMFNKNDVFVILTFLKDPAWEEQGLLQRLEDMTEQMHADSGLNFSMGIGNPVTNVLDLELSYKEAVKALQTGVRMNKGRFVHSYQIHEVSRLLRMIPYDELKQFYMETFRELVSSHDGENSELLRTLCVYYENHCALAETAKQLYVHRNTVIYRLEKCEKLTGRRLKDPMESLRFRIAFTLEPLIKVKPS
ncbi:hypothetical protein SY83_10065 [Paenibacillus swuensis]|uniref:PucR family transcriptional regulator n=1 Tax=Paenibacillus swuensis TaxID=1178515 RepID=A0A172TIE9_9BACL|nr:PucR family transcriptional regulator [Paenibacillus swuensis]ANE46563.1 hypothetical protein SY83_10065 [Paenibacillus swuensis]